MIYSQLNIFAFALNKLVHDITHLMTRVNSCYLLPADKTYYPNNSFSFLLCVNGKMSRVDEGTIKNTAYMKRILTPSSKFEIMLHCVLYTVNFRNEAIWLDNAVFVPPLELRKRLANCLYSETNDLFVYDERIYPTAEFNLVCSQMEKQYSSTFQSKSNSFIPADAIAFISCVQKVFSVYLSISKFNEHIRGDRQYEFVYDDTFVASKQDNPAIQDEEGNKLLRVIVPKNGSFHSPQWCLFFEKDVGNRACIEITQQMMIDGGYQEMLNGLSAQRIDCDECSFRATGMIFYDVGCTSECEIKGKYYEVSGGFARISKMFYFSIKQGLSEERRKEGEEKSANVNIVERVRWVRSKHLEVMKKWEDKGRVIDNKVRTLLKLSRTSRGNKPEEGEPEAWKSIINSMKEVSELVYELAKGYLSAILFNEDEIKGMHKLISG